MADELTKRLEVLATRMDNLEGAVASIVHERRQLLDELERLKDTKGKSILPARKYPQLNRRH